MNAGMAGGIAALVLIVAVTVLFICLWLAKRRRERRDPADRGAVALGKHPNVVRANLSNILSNTLYLHPIHTLAPLRHVSPLGGHLCYTIIAIFCSILAIGIQVQLLSAWMGKKWNPMCSQNSTLWKIWYKIWNVRKVATTGEDLVAVLFNIIKCGLARRQNNRCLMFVNKSVFSSVSCSKMKKLFSHVTHLGSHLIFDANQGIYLVNMFPSCFMLIFSYLYPLVRAVILVGLRFGQPEFELQLVEK